MSKSNEDPVGKDALAAQNSASFPAETELEVCCKKCKLMETSHSVVDTELSEAVSKMDRVRADNLRLQIENAKLRRTLKDFAVRCVSGRLTGQLPDNFLEPFNALPDRPFEHILRHLSARQIVQLRSVSRRFNQLIKKCSKTMPKLEFADPVVITTVFNTNQLCLTSFDMDDGWSGKSVRFNKRVPLSDLLRFVRVDGTLVIDDTFAAKTRLDTVLEQLSKAWLTVRPKKVVFARFLRQLSAEALKKFLTAISPFVAYLKFRDFKPTSLLTDEILLAAGRLDGLVVTSPVDEPGDSIAIGDALLNSLASGDKMPSYFCVAHCSGFTPVGICAFIQKWINTGSNSCTLVFADCANVTSISMKEALGSLTGVYRTIVDYRGFAIKCVPERRLTLDFYRNEMEKYCKDFPADNVTNMYPMDYDDLIDMFLAEQDFEQCASEDENEDEESEEDSDEEEEESDDDEGESYVDDADDQWEDVEDDEDVEKYCSWLSSAGQR